MDDDDFNQQIFNNVFSLWLSGAAEMKNDAEILYEDKWNRVFTIEFPTKSPKRAIVRKYWDNGLKQVQCNFKNGLMHGEYTEYYQDGYCIWYHCKFTKGIQDDR